MKRVSSVSLKKGIGITETTSRSKQAPVYQTSHHAAGSSCTTLQQMPPYHSQQVLQPSKSQLDLRQPVSLDWSGKALRHVPRIDSESPLLLNLSGNKLRDVAVPPTVITLNLAGNRLQTLDLEALAR